MKKVVLCLLAMAAVSAAVSCDNTNVEDDFTKPVIIGEGSESQVPHPQLPMDIYDLEVKTSSDGVSLSVTSVTEDNVKFVCRPGEDVKSYALNVVPLSLLYNHLLNNDALGMDKVKIEDMIFEAVFGGAFAGYAFTPTVLGDEWAEFEFDWMSTEYPQSAIVPDAQYLIIAVGCYDDTPEITNAAEMVLVYFETPKKELKGAPAVELDVITGYHAFRVNHIPNADAASFYYETYNTDDVDEFSDIFGDRLLRDLLRHVKLPVSTASENDMSYLIQIDNPDPNIALTALTVALDANGTPAEYPVRKDFRLKTIPEDADVATLEYRIKTDALSSCYAEYDVVLGKSTYAGFHRTYTLEEAQALMEMDSTQRAPIAMSIDREGYGVANANFSFDEAAGEAVGSHFTTTVTELNLLPDTEYVIAYVGRNYYGIVSDIYFSDPFRTDPLITDRPTDNKSDLKLEFTNVSYSSFTYSFTFNPEHTSTYYFIVTDPVQAYTDDETGKTVMAYDVPAKDASRDEWMDFFFCDEALNYSVTAEEGGYATYMNVWERSMSGHDSFTLSGFEQGQHYEYAYVSIDMDGVVSEVKFAEVTTKTLAVGPEPVMEIVDPVFDPATGKWTSVRFNILQDVGTFYASVDQGSELYLDRLGTDRMTAEEFYSFWSKKALNALPHDADAEGGYTWTPEMFGWEKGRIGLAYCVGIGKDEDGNEVYSKLEYLILTPEGEAKLLSDYYPDYQEK